MATGIPLQRSSGSLQASIGRQGECVVPKTSGVSHKVPAHFKCIRSAKAFLIRTPFGRGQSAPFSFRLQAAAPSLKAQRKRHRVWMASTGKTAVEEAASAEKETDMTVLFVEMGVGYDQHGQDITSAAVKACKNAITSNSIPAFRTGAIPGVSWGEMKLKLVLGVPQEAAHGLDIEKVKSIFPYGEIIDVEVKDGGLVCSSGVAIEALGDKNDKCYIVNAAVYVGY